ncbi:MAG: hypothetical protein R3E58_05300 [Phycisphaerae bacterium]
MCPADRVKIATPFYPNGTSIKGTGDPADPVTAGGGTKYWGLLSYAINEDIVGIEAQKKNNQPWPAVWKNGVWGERISRTGPTPDFACRAIWTRCSIPARACC